MFRATVTIAISEEQRQRLENLLTPKQVRQAMFQAVKRTIGGPRSGVLGAFRARVLSEINITKKYVDRVIVAKGPYGEIPEGRVSVSRESIPLIAFRPRVTKKGGATATIGKGKPPVTYRHGFRATVKSAEQRAGGLPGHFGIFYRADHLPTKGPNFGAKNKKGQPRFKLTKKGRAGRFAITEAMGPSVLSVYGEQGTTKVAQEELAKAHELLDKNIQSQIDRFTK